MINQFAKLALSHFCARKTVLSFALFCFLQVTSFGQTNEALVLNGTNSFATLGTVAPAGNFSTGVTIECWVRWGAFNTWSRLLDMGNGAASNNILFANEGTTGRLRYEVYVNGTTQGLSIPADLVTNRWYHVAVTQTSAGLATIYVDGVSVASATVQTPVNVSRATAYIGRSSWGSDGYLSGRIDEMRIWNLARSASDIRGNMLKKVAAGTTGLVASYSFNEGSGTTLTNATSGMGVGNGTFSNVSWTSSPAQLTANAVALDGVDDMVSIGSPLSAGTSYTKEAWVYITKSIAMPQNIVSSAGAPLWIGGNNLQAGNNGASAQVIDNTSFPTNTWVHVALTYDAVTKAMVLYRNGVQVASNTVNESYQNQPNFIGAWYNGTSNESFLGGRIDEVRIWNTVRSQADIAADMNKELDPAGYPGLTAYYTFNQGISGGDNTGMLTVPNQVGTTNASLVNFDLSNATSNFGVQNNTLVVLPVRLAQFSVQKQKGSVLLQWTTSNEESSYRFVAEHSNNGKDWTLVGEVAAAGNSSSVRYYSLLHSTPVSGTNYYRLAHLDRNGKTDNGAVRTVIFEQRQQPFTIISSPVQQGIILVQVNAGTTLSLITQDGKLIWTKAVAPGRHAIPVVSVAKGVLYVTGSGTTEKVFLP